MMLKLRLPLVVLGTVACWSGCGDDDHPGSGDTVHDDAGLDAHVAQPDGRRADDARSDDPDGTFVDAAAGSSSAGDAQTSGSAGDAGAVDDVRAVEMDAGDATVSDAQTDQRQDGRAAPIQDASATDDSSMPPDASETVATADAGLCTSGSMASHASDVLILQDASLSLTASGMWTQMVTAVEQVIGMYEGQLAFGLSVFPPGGQPSCSAGALDISFGLKNAAAIKAELDATLAEGLTPTPDSLRAAHTFMGARTAHDPAYIILITDGEPDCTGASGNGDASADMLDEVKALFADNIHTFAVGPSNTSASALLDQVAVEGGTSRAYTAASEAQYEQALSLIAEQLSGCGAGH